LLRGIAPAIQATRPNLNAALKNESGTAGRIRFGLRQALVVLQVAISLLTVSESALGKAISDGKRVQT
jgi:hypothetical protein